MLLKQFGGLLESILGILAVDAFIVKLSCWRFNFREYFEHVVCVEFAGSYQGEKECSVRSKSAIKTKFHHQWLSVGELLLLTAVKWLRNEQVFAENSLNNLQMLIGVICLAESLLARHLAGSCVHMTIWTWSSLARILSIREHGTSIVKSLFFFLCALLEEYLPKDIFLFLVLIIVLYVVIVWLIEYTVWVVIAVGVFVAYTSGLTHRWVWVEASKTLWSILAIRSLALSIASLVIISLTSNQQNPLVETANHRNLRLLLLLLLLLICSWLSCRTLLSSSLLRCLLTLSCRLSLSWRGDGATLLRRSICICLLRLRLWRSSTCFSWRNLLILRS